MEHEFYENATIQDSPAALIFFCTLKIGPHEPDQTFQSIDDGTGALTPEHITKNQHIISVCNDSVRVRAPDITTPTSGQITYDPYPVQVTLPQSGTEKIEVVSLVIDNIDRAFVDILRRLRFPLKVDVGVGWVTATNDDRHHGDCASMEHRLSGLDLVDVTITAETITGKLIIDNILWRKYPNNNEIYEHYNFPGLWGLDPDDPT